MKNLPLAYRIIEDPRLKSKGARWFHSDDHHSPSMSKASLGEFFFEVIRVGAQIGTVWPFNPQYDRSPVYISVYMTEEMKASLEERTRYRFRDPPTLKLA